MSLLDIDINVEQPDIRAAFIKRIENIIADQFYKSTSLWHPRFAADNPIIHVSMPKQIPQYFTIGRYAIKTEFPPVAGTIRLRTWKSDDVFNKTTDFGYIDIDMYALQYTPDRYRGLNFVNLLKEY